MTQLVSPQYDSFTSQAQRWDLMDPTLRNTRNTLPNRAKGASMQKITLSVV